jgi:hypothetical protein
MKYKYYILTLGFALIVASLMINDLTRMKKDKIELPILTNTDTIYVQLDSLEKQQDTIKLFYEKEISNYHILPSSERIKLFSNRINR